MITSPEAITRVVVSRLEEITQGNDYSFDLARVVRQDRKGETPKYEHLSILIEQTANNRVEALDIPGNPPALAYQLALDLKCYVRDVTGEPRSTNENEMAASAVKAITSVGNDWYSFGGYAVDCDFGSVEPLPQSDGEFTGCILPVFVTYRVNENDPYVVRA